MHRLNTRNSRFVVLFLGAALAAANPAQAGLADIIPGLFAEDLLLAPPQGPFPSHEAHFLDEAAALSSTGRLLNQSLVSQLSTFPLASSAGGFSYSFDPALGVSTRATQTFAPIFTERAYTTGDGRWSVGLTHVRADYESLDGLDLNGGEIVFQLQHLNIPPVTDEPDPFFEGDLISAQIELEIQTETTILFASYGATDRFDLSLALPLVQIDLGAAATLTVDRLATRDIPGIHHFEGEEDQITIRDQGFASGPGDLVVRGKYRFLTRPDGGLAVLADLRLPTGDEENLLGSGLTQASLVLVGSRQFGNLAGHFNLGYGSAFGDSAVVADLPDEVIANVAMEMGASPRVTVVAELIGRILLDATTIERNLVAFPFQPLGEPLQIAERPVVSFQENNQELLLGAFGVKWNVGGTTVISADVVTPFTDDGLRDGLVLILGADYSF